MYPYLIKHKKSQEYWVLDDLLIIKASSSAAAWVDLVVNLGDLQRRGQVARFVVFSVYRRPSLPARRPDVQNFGGGSDCRIVE